MPRGADAAGAVYLDETNHDFTLRLRLDTANDTTLQGAVYLCVNDRTKSFVEGRFTASAADALAQNLLYQAGAKP